MTCHHKTEASPVEVGLRPTLETAWGLEDRVLIYCATCFEPLTEPLDTPALRNTLKTHQWSVVEGSKYE